MDILTNCRRFCLLAVPVLLIATPSAHAQSGLLRQRSAHFFSHEGNIGFLLVGIAAGPTRAQRLRSVDVLVVGAGLAEGLKRVFREKRPDTNERNSFPSGHATAAFAVADQAALASPKSASLWYIGAALIADSRVTLRRHYPHDVLAGALLGVAVSRASQQRPRGLLVDPTASGIQLHWPL